MGARYCPVLINMVLSFNTLIKFIPKSVGMWGLLSCPLGCGWDAEGSCQAGPWDPQPSRALGWVYRCDKVTCVAPSEWLCLEFSIFVCPASRQDNRGQNIHAFNSDPITKSLGNCGHVTQHLKILIFFFFFTHKTVNITSVLSYLKGSYKAPVK